MNWCKLINLNQHGMVQIREFTYYEKTNSAYMETVRLKTDPEVTGNLPMEIAEVLNVDFDLYGIVECCHGVLDGVTSESEFGPEFAPKVSKCKECVIRHTPVYPVYKLYLPSKTMTMCNYSKRNCLSMSYVFEDMIDHWVIRGDITTKRWGYRYPPGSSSDTTRPIILNDYICF
jgi:hypothetical protein